MNRIQRLKLGMEGTTLIVLMGVGTILLGQMAAGATMALLAPGVTILAVIKPDRIQ
jgi:hypothetical protein